MGMSFAPLFIELGLQHFIHFVIFIRDAAGLALRPATGRGWRGTLGDEIVFFLQIGIVAVGASRRGDRPGHIARFITASTAAATTTAARATIFAPFAVARSAAGWPVFLLGQVFVDRRQRRELIVLKRHFIGIGFDRLVVPGGGTRREGFTCLFLIAATTATTSTPATTRMFSTFVLRTIETETFFWRGRFVAQLFARGNEFFFKMPARWRLMSSFGHAFAETAAGRAVAAWRTAFFIAAVISTPMTIAATTFAALWSSFAIAPFAATFRPLFGPRLGTAATFTTIAVSASTLVAFARRSTFSSRGRSKQIRRQIVRRRRPGFERLAFGRRRGP